MNEPRFEVFPQMRRIGEVEPGGAFVGEEPTGEFGWRFRAANGQISAIGGEGFTRREDAHRAVIDFVRALVESQTECEVGAFTGEGAAVIDVEE